MITFTIGKCGKLPAMLLLFNFNRGIFLTFFVFSCMYFILHIFICRPSDSTVSEHAEIEPSAGIFKQSIGAKNGVGIGLSYLGIDSWAP